MLYVAVAAIAAPHACAYDPLYVAYAWTQCKH